MSDETLRSLTRCQACGQVNFNYQNDVLCGACLDDIESGRTLEQSLPDAEPPL